MCDKMEWNILWNPADPTLRWIRREDVIGCTVRNSNIGPDEIEFQLISSESRVRWWKGIRVVTRGEIQLGVSEFQDDVREGAILRFNVGQILPHRLQFWKAKFLGIHTCMYELDLSSMPGGFGGNRVIFDWFRDEKLPGDVIS